MSTSCALRSFVSFKGRLSFVPVLLFIIFSAFRLSFALPNNGEFGSNVVLIGDAKFTNNSTSIQFTDPKISSPSTGFVIQKKPIKLFSPNSNSSNPTSISTDFIFSISPYDGNGMSFFIIPKSFLSNFSSNGSMNFPSHGVNHNFDSLMNVNANHIRIDVSRLVSVKGRKISSIYFPLYSGMKLHTWIDYDASSKRIEVRMVTFGNTRPYNPLFVHQVDLFEMWGNEQVVACLGSSTRSSVQISSVHSWNIRTRNVPNWLHSKPVILVPYQNHDKMQDNRKTCFLGILSGLVFITGCCALIAMIVLFLLAASDKGSETFFKIPTKSIEGFRYEKINVVLEDDVKN